MSRSPRRLGSYFVRLVFLCSTLLCSSASGLPAWPFPGGTPACSPDWEMHPTWAPSQWKYKGMLRNYIDSSNPPDNIPESVSSTTVCCGATGYPLPTLPGKECFYFGAVDNINDFSSSTKMNIISETTGDGSCAISLTPLPLGGCGLSRFDVRCRVPTAGSARIRFELMGDDDVWIRYRNSCCRDIGDTDRCVDLPDMTCDVPSCNTSVCGSESVHGQLFFARDLVDDSNYPQVPTTPDGSQFRVRWPIPEVPATPTTPAVPAQPDNTVPPSPVAWPISCLFEGYVKNAHSIHGDMEENIAPRLHFLPRFGVACEDPDDPEQAFNNPVTTTKYDTGCGTVPDLPQPKEAWLWFDRGCEAESFKHTCRFQDPGTPLACGDLSDWADRIMWDPHLELDANDSAALHLEICCCEGSTTDCCERASPVLVE